MPSPLRVTSANAPKPSPAAKPTTHSSLCIRVSPCVYGCLPVYTGVSLCIRVSPCVYGCLPVYTGVSLCIRVSPCVYGCLPVYTGVSLCIWVSPCVYGCLPVYRGVTLVYSSCYKHHTVHMFHIACTEYYMVNMAPNYSMENTMCMFIE